MPQHNRRGSGASQRCRVGVAGANIFKNFIIRLKYRSCCSSSSSRLLFIQKFTWISRTNSKFKLKLEKVFFMLFSFTFWFCCFSFFFFVLLQELIVRVLGVALIVQLYVCACVCSIYVYVFAFVLCICSLQKQESKTRHNVSFCSACANGIWPIYASSYSTHSHTHTHTDRHTHRLAYWVTFSLQGFKFVVSVFFVCVAFLTLQLTRGNFSIFSSLSRRSHLQLEVNWVTSTVG